MHKHLQRLERIWVEPPIFFVTTCAENRRAILAEPRVAEILIREWRAAEMRHGWLVGRYVVMPDHVHFFCGSKQESKSLSDFVGNWKRWRSRAIHALDQPGTASPVQSQTRPTLKGVVPHTLRKDLTMSQTLTSLLVHLIFSTKNPGFQNYS